MVNILEIEKEQLDERLDRINKASSGFRENIGNIIRRKNNVIPYRFRGGVQTYVTFWVKDQKTTM